MSKHECNTIGQQDTGKAAAAQRQSQQLQDYSSDNRSARIQPNIQYLRRRCQRWSHRYNVRLANISLMLARCPTLPPCPPQDLDALDRDDAGVVRCLQDYVREVTAPACKQRVLRYVGGHYMLKLVVTRSGGGGFLPLPPPTTSMVRGAPP
jgi:hypothetical protein